MQRLNTTGIVLSRRDYGEADRIVTFLTKNNGKLSTLVKGARKPKSRMAGGIELFSVSNLTFIDSKKDLVPLVGAELTKHYGSISTDIDRAMWAYEVLKLMYRVLPENCDENEFDLLSDTLRYLDDKTIPKWAIEVWFYQKWLVLHGQQVNTIKDINGKPLQPGQSFAYSFEDNGFIASQSGTFNDSHIKLLRLSETLPPQKLAQINGGESVSNPVIKILALSANRVV